MKKNLLITAAFIAASFTYSVHADAQISVGVNIGVQPIWGPTGYDHVDYYYIPDVDAYYDVNTRMYTYMDGGAWVTRPELLPRYRTFDLYGAHKVVINERTPWMHGDRYRKQYARYRGMHDQHPIRDSHDQRYYENPGHPHHSEWHGGDHGHDHGHEDHHDEGHR